jgi:hypothetical protein
MQQRGFGKRQKIAEQSRAEAERESDDDKTSPCDKRFCCRPAVRSSAEAGALTQTHAEGSERAGLDVESERSVTKSGTKRKRIGHSSALAMNDEELVSPSR